MSNLASRMYSATPSVFLLYALIKGIPHFACRMLSPTRVCSIVSCLVEKLWGEYISEVGINIIKNHTWLDTMGEKVNFDKYQQTTMSAKRTLHLFPLKGFGIGIACMKHGYDTIKKAPPKASASKSAASTAAASAPCGPEVVGGATLRQSGVDADKTLPFAENQLARAGTTYGGLDGYHKAYMATSVLQHTASYHSEQAKSLRNVDDSRVWELDQLKGKCHLHVRRTIAQLVFSRSYNRCGIENDWRNVTLKTTDVRVVSSDDTSGML